MEIKKVVVCGGGVLGSQIAFQSAYCGYNVTMLIRKEDSVDAVQEKLKNLKNTYIKTIGEMILEFNFFNTIFNFTNYIYWIFTAFFHPVNKAIHLKRMSVAQFQSQQTKRNLLKNKYLQFLGHTEYVLGPHPDTHTRLQIYF